MTASPIWTTVPAEASSPRNVPPTEIHSAVIVARTISTTLVNTSAAINNVLRAARRLSADMFVYPPGMKITFLREHSTLIPALYA